MLERRDRFVAASALWLTLAAPSRAAAQPPTVEPPHRIDAIPTPYPPSGSGAAYVLLELVVDRLGQVVDAHVVEGRDPFATTALHAAHSWKYSPAKRDGLPVGARIRMRIDFAPPSPAPAAPLSLPPSPASRPPVRHDDIQEITVHGVRPEPGRQEMSSAEVRQLPGAFGDAFRAMEALPGVIPLVSGLPYFLVRGAPPATRASSLTAFGCPLSSTSAWAPQ